jgi:tetratricopeptide (TPR) repeat protein
MNPLFRTIALFLGLLALVVVAALVMVKYTGEGGGSIPTEQTPAAPQTAAVSPVTMNPDLLNGMDALRDNRLEKARESFARVPESDPGFFEALKNLAMVQWQMGEMEDAEKTFVKLSSLQPDNPGAHLSIGWAQYSLGRHAEAELSTLRAIELDPNSVAARYNVALFRLSQGRLPEAIKAYHRAMSRDGAMAYVGTAREHLLQLMERRPDFADVHYALAYFANAVSNREMEIEELEKYLALNPAGPAVEVARARLAEAKEASRR